MIEAEIYASQRSDVSRTCSHAIKIGNTVRDKETITDIHNNSMIGEHVQTQPAGRSHACMAISFHMRDAAPILAGHTTAVYNS
jgi:hypothetical protein